MNSIFIDCSLGISGDMLACALFDLGVPNHIFEDNLVKLNIDKSLKILFNESKSYGIKGIRCTIHIIYGGRSCIVTTSCPSVFCTLKI